MSTAALLTFRRQLPQVIVLAAFALVAEPILRRQYAHDRLDDVVWDAQAHRAGTVAHFQLETNDHHGFIGRNDLYQLRVGSRNPVTLNDSGVRLLHASDRWPSPDR